uniref:Calcium homeostasis modulator family member 5, tandem duplicate 2 n=1 Tax=Neogobius melanostomus TaxID=47308 RepID=A0A8C6SNA3_9GOBI
GASHVPLWKRWNRAYRREGRSAADAPSRVPGLSSEASEVIPFWQVNLTLSSLHLPLTRCSFVLPGFGLAADRQHHPVPPGGDLCGAVLVSGQLPPAEVLAALRPGGELCPGLAVCRTRPGTRQTQHRKLLQQDPTGGHPDALKAGLGESVVPLQVPLQKREAVLQQPAPLRGDRDGDGHSGWSDEELLDHIHRIPPRHSRCSGLYRRRTNLILNMTFFILGWCIIIIAAVVGLCGTCYTNCRSKVSYLQLTFWKRYVQKEKERFDAYAADYSTKLAERNLKSFFENKPPEPFPFPNHHAWEQISELYMYTRSEQCYSTLQRYVEGKDHEDYNSEMKPVMDMEREMEMS